MIELDAAGAVAAAGRVSRWQGPFTIKEDTTNFLAIQPSDILQIQGHYYLIKGEVREPRFGLEDEPKWWVKRAQELPSGRKVIIKLVFLEEFEVNVGSLKFRCFRSPPKEARILDKVAGHPGFMQGSSFNDPAGNSVRVLEIVPGLHLNEVVEGNPIPHEIYFHEVLPPLMKKFVQAVRDMAHLHSLGEVHGDIRRDHLIEHRQTGRLVWIDFDYAYEQGRANRFAWDLFGLGNVLNYLTMAGAWTPSRLRKEGYNEAADRLSPEDMNIVFKNYLANPAKAFPYIPRRLNLVCRHFSAGARLFYQSAEELADDLETALAEI